MQVPLTAEDRAVLALEGARLVGHTATVVHLPGGAPDLRQLRDAVTRRLPAAPRLTWRLSGTPEEPVWRSAEVDVAAHVRAVDAAGPLDGSGLRTELVRLFGEHLDRGRPLWRMDVVGPVAGGGAVLVWRVHHALADGGTGMRLAQDVTATNGLVLISSGTVMTEAMLDRLANFNRALGLVEPVLTAA